ncbi:MAG: NAD-dependent epimerase/dehydratase family protein [Polyangiaceae bacterium]|jgi:hypothetical protein|nr:NAD-dependent epimerase/dehydratase family protein [Polyangiaceae bacterium]
MRTVLLDKVGSVTLNCQLAREVRVTDAIHAVEGGVVAVRVLNSKSTYNQLELPSGRMSKVKPGDVAAVALGHRKGLFGYSGHLPEHVCTGDRLHILNLGGVLGVCDSINPDLGEPFSCEVLGQVLHFPYLGERIGIPAHISHGALPMNGPLDLHAVPMVVVVGTSMSAGKTGAACAIVQAFVHGGLRVAAGKATGVSLRRDILAMGDAGAQRTLIFTDFGIVTTTADSAPPVARAIVNRLAADRPDVIVLELGDGLLGLYGVAGILDDADLRVSFRAVVLAASDPVAAWGGVKLLRDRHDLPTTAVTGPATDNTAGAKLVEAQTAVPAHNARSNPTRLARVVVHALGLAAIWKEPPA